MIEPDHEATILAGFFNAVEQHDLDRNPAWAAVLAEQSGDLLAARRADLADAEWSRLDAWGGALDRAELLNAVLVGFLDAAFEQTEEERRELGAGGAAPLGVTLSAARCTELADDIHDLIRRGSIETALAVARTLSEASVIARAIGAHREIAELFFRYQQRAHLRSRKAILENFVRGMKGTIDGPSAAAALLAETERAIRQVDHEHELFPWDLGWAHAILLENDDVYRLRDERGRARSGPAISDVERLTRVRPHDRAMRALANPFVHANPVSGIFLDESEEKEWVAMLLPLVARLSSAAVWEAVVWAIELDDFTELEVFDHVEDLEDEVDAEVQGVLKRLEGS